MSNFEYFEIEIDKQNSFYLAGENLNGCLKIKLKKKIEINSIKVYLNGGATVKWNHISNLGEGGYASEKYIDSVLILLEKQDNDALYLEDKEYDFNFEFMIPSDLPSSFQTSFGQIEYFLTGVIDRDWIYDKIVKVPFRVKNIVDLNSIPICRQGYGVCEEKVICCGPCKSEPILADFSIKKCGFVPGESIDFKIKIENKSNKQINKIKVTLKQNIEFHANDNKTWTTNEILSVVSDTSIKPFKNFSWEDEDNEKMRIPLVPQTSTGRIIEITYSLVLSFKPFASISKKIPIPIYIGFIPLR